MKKFKDTLIKSFVFVIFFLSASTEYSFGQDSFEVDDTYVQANVIVLDYLPANQEHTIHHVDDVDWVKFYALEDKTYMINADYMDAYIELYDTDGKTLIADLLSDEYSTDTLYWDCPIGGEGIYYVKISYGSPPTYFEGAAYTLSIQTYLGFGLPSILTGLIKNTNNEGVPNARIKLSGVDSSGSGISLGNGSFVASVQINGTYRITISANGHQTLVQNVYVPGNRTFTLQVLTNTTKPLPSLSWLNLLLLNPSTKNTSWWGAGNNVCCSTSSFTFSLTHSSVIKNSSLATCSSTATWEGWQSVLTGTKSFNWSATSAGCGNYSGSFTYNLLVNNAYWFRLELDSNSSPAVYVYTYPQSASSLQQTTIVSDEGINISNLNSPAYDKQKLTDIITINFPVNSLMQLAN